MSISFTKLGSFLLLFFSNRFLIFSNFLLFLFFWHPYGANIGTVEVVPQAAYIMLILLDPFFFLLLGMVVVGGFGGFFWLFLLPSVPDH